MKFQIGDRVYNKARGIGTVLKLDEKDRSFAVLTRFKGKTNLAWLPAKELTPANED